MTDEEPDYSRYCIRYWSDIDPILIRYIRRVWKNKIYKNNARKIKLLEVKKGDRNMTNSAKTGTWLTLQKLPTIFCMESS